MNWKPEKLGAEPKKLAILAGLVLVAGYFYFSGSGESGPTPSPTPRRTAVTAPTAAIPTAPDRAAKRGWDGGRDTLSDWRPSVKRKKGFDPTGVDPTLKLALLERVRESPLEGGQRSLFDFSQEPVKEVTVKVADRGRKGMPPPAPVAVQPPPEQAAAPVAPPIPLKFYGFVSATESKRAFFLDGDDIVVASEGDLIKKRYKVVRIGINSATVEDEQFKNQQTISLVQEQQDG
ncbi:MAG TPA: hypothetical protein VHD76_04305 [Bryobacteraceae bacterium]|jgi:hypothetical protein|nr:hypothetical protein [Bryobacteraceae bacterium]